MQQERGDKKWTRTNQETCKRRDARKKRISNELESISGRAWQTGVLQSRKTRSQRVEDESTRKKRGIEDGTAVRSHANEETKKMRSGMSRGERKMTRRRLAGRAGGG